MMMEQQIQQKLEGAFNPQKLIVTNESHLHAGHAGDDGSGESHFKIEIAAEAFGDLSRVDRERLIYKALSEEMAIIHALTIKILTL